MIREADARAEVLPRSRVEVVDLLPDDDQPSARGIEGREILLAVVHRTLEIPAETEVDVQFAGQPPRVLREQIGQVLVDLASDVAAQNRRLVDVTGEEVGERRDVGVVTRHAQQASPRSLRSVEEEISADAGVVAAAGADRFDADPADFSTEPHLVRPFRIRQRVGHVGGHVRAPRVRADAGRIESGDREKRRAGQIGSADAGVEAEVHGVEAAVGVGERLVEVVQAEENLVGERRLQNRVVHHRVVLHLDRPDLEVIGAIV